MSGQYCHWHANGPTIALTEPANVAKKFRIGDPSPLLGVSLRDGSGAHICEYGVIKQFLQTSAIVFLTPEIFVQLYLWVVEARKSAAFVYVAKPTSAKQIVQAVPLHQRERLALLVRPETKYKCYHAELILVRIGQARYVGLTALGAEEKLASEWTAESCVPQRSETQSRREIWPWSNKTNRFGSGFPSGFFAYETERESAPCTPWNDENDEEAHKMVDSLIGALPCCETV
jgi:hypothetical protein